MAPTLNNPSVTFRVNVPVVSVLAKLPTPPDGEYANTSAFAITLLARSFTIPRICFVDEVSVNAFVQVTAPSITHAPPVILKFTGRGGR